jgi:hypothetical protein
MIKPVGALLDTAKRVWSAVTGGAPAGASGMRQNVLVHDPDAEKPKNLDDPFHDPKVQERVAKLISQAAANAPRSKPREE